MEKTYSELITLKTFEERFEYLKLDGNIYDPTFGKNRYLNQDFYRSKEWKRARDFVIARDLGCDLGINDRPIVHDVCVHGKNTKIGKIIVHHINPIKPEDIIDGTNVLLNPENLICVSPETHNAIHYGNLETVEDPMITRSKDDTCPWKRGML